MPNVSTPLATRLSRPPGSLDDVWDVPHIRHVARFDEFLAELVAEATAVGPEAVAELEAFRLQYSRARQLAARWRALHLTQTQVALS